MGRGLTLDTGALVALERRRHTIAKALRTAREMKRRITVPAPVVAEWWRGQTGPLARALDGVIVEPLTKELAMAAGEALARTGGSNAIDAIIVVSAATRGDVVLTDDPQELEALARYRDVYVEEV